MCISNCGCNSVALHVFTEQVVNYQPEITHERNDLAHLIFSSVIDPVSPSVDIQHPVENVEWDTVNLAFYITIFSLYFEPTDLSIGF